MKASKIKSGQTASKTSKKSGHKREIYLIRLGQTELYKIGLSKNSHHRLKQLQTGCPQNLAIITIFTSEDAFKLEKIIHNRLSHKKMSPNFHFDFDMLEGEWFNLETSDVIGFVPLCLDIEKTIKELKEAGNPFV